MTIVSDSVLVESKSARDNQLESVSHRDAQSILNKVKALFFAVWKNEGITTTEQLAAFYEIEPNSIRQVLKRHQDEFELDGLKSLRGKDLKEVRDVLSLTSTAVNLTIWTPRAVLRLGMLLRDSAIAKAVRTSAVNAIETTIPAQSARIRELELELRVAQAQTTAAQSQERLMQATNAIANLHGTGMVALILGKPDAVITHTEVIEKTIAVDPKGRVVAQSDGLTIGYLTKRLGFKNNEQTWQWLNSVQLGKDSGAWSKELTAHPTLKLPRQLLPQVQRLFAYQVGNRQLLLGEGGRR
ncbi:DNA-binding protein [Chlorogloea sp. CCALA 695]|uniref:DNA-binding protein n=1 Tax=Chlorogloea sp. CCALA 695 TaxID=2107693 RepID=UPI000D07CEC5|nr:DNA-binding protein [Chlorogloea sp. CCALA 695]PSB28361.1 DNA-binding protein [Chlorogloea sp. CCALA 695]